VLQARFPLFSKVEVNGKEAHPLFAFLKAQFGIKTIPWNFQKV
jgi:glutathione peroxidase